MCPSCERFIGPADACPYCGADAARGPALKSLRFAALILSTAGLALLCVLAIHRQAPRLRIAEIAPAMNFAHVRVRGVVAGKPYVAAPGGRADYLSFTIADGAATLRVTAQGQVARALVERHGIPPAGTPVEVTGRLSVTSDQRPRLQLQAADAVVLEPAAEAAPALPEGGREA
jgi:hypothetical protein